MKTKKLPLVSVIALLMTILFQITVNAQENYNRNMIAGSLLAVSGISDKVPPTVPKGLSVANKAYTSISLKWTASSDNIGVRGYEVYRDGRKIVTIKKPEYTNTSLIPGRTYTYSIKAYDAAGNISDYSASLAAATISDEQIPSVPKNLTAGSTTYTTVNLNWEPSTDNTGVKNYEIYCNDKKVASTTATYYVCKRLLPGNSYRFSVKAYDISGNCSPHSAICSAGTIPDTAPPSTPAGLKTSSVSATEINLAWSPSTDNVKVKKYEVFCDGVSKGTTSKTSLRCSNLLPGKIYTYTVRALDDTGNVSGNSTQFKARTADDTKPPQAPADLTASTPSSSSVSLKWKASTDDIKVKGYYIYCNGIKIADTTRTSYTVRGLKNLGLGVFYIKAYDLADNLSEGSKSITVVMF